MEKHHHRGLLSFKSREFCGKILVSGQQKPSHFPICNFLLTFSVKNIYWLAIYVNHSPTLQPLVGTVATTSVHLSNAYLTNLEYDLPQSLVPVEETVPPTRNSGDSRPQQGNFLFLIQEVIKILCERALQLQNTAV